MNGISLVTNQVTLHTAADRIHATELQTLIAQYAQYFHYMILAYSEERQFRTFDLAHAQAVATWQEGHLFGPEVELRWRPKLGCFDVCLLSETVALPANFTHIGPEVLERQEEHLRLWGEHMPQNLDAQGQPFWLEAQIPRLLHYPVQSAPRIAALHVARYLRNGAVEFVRFLQLEGWEYA